MVVKWSASPGTGALPVTGPWCVRARPLVIGLWLFLLVPSARSATWLVDPTGAGDATTIGAGLGLAAPGDTVEVTCGIYFERHLQLADSVHVRSRTGQPDCVTIDAGGIGRVFRAIGVQGTQVVGFTITGGDHDYGGGMLLLSLSSIVLENCVFTGNSALFGGGIYCHHSPIHLENCTVSGNSAAYHGGGLVVDDFADPTISNSTIVDNVAGENGGGLFCYYESSVTVDGTLIAGNLAGGSGGAMHFVDATTTLMDCTLTGNFASAGGALGGWDYDAALSGCTVSGNRATDRGGGIRAGLESTLSLMNTIVWGNCAADAHQVYLEDGASTVTFQCCDVDTASGGVGGIGGTVWTGANLHADPLFCSPLPCGLAPTTMGGYELGAGSPCLPANSGGCGLIGAQGPGACRSLFDGSWGRIKNRFRAGRVR